MNDNPRSLIIIPARGGSKGIPGKNIKPFCGKPLILHTIDQARQIADDCDICVSTDSEVIAQCVENYGLKIPFIRPAHLATDTSGTYEVLLHAVEWYQQQGRQYDRIILLQTTSPLRTADDIKAAISLWTPEVDMVVTVCEAATNPYYNAYEADQNGYLHISKGDGKFTRRQDTPKVWEYNGAVYVITTQSLLLHPLSEFTRRIPSVMQRTHSLDLDTPLDWQIAETLAKH